MISMLALFGWLTSLILLGFDIYVGVTAVAPNGTALRVRLAMSVIVVLAGQYLMGFALLLLGIFGREAFIAILLVSCCLAYFVARSKKVRTSISGDLAAIHRTILGFRTSLGWSAIAALFLIVAWFYAIRGVVTPPMDWDFLTYHGTRAALWVQEGRLMPGFHAPGFWQGYKEYPVAGDLITAWSMVLYPSDIGVALAWICVWVCIGIMVFCATRSLGGSRYNAALGAVVAMFLPACLHHMSSGYVDNAIALCFLASLVCFIESEKSARLVFATAGLVGLGVALAIKVSALPYLATGMLLWLWLVYRHRDSASASTIVHSLIIVGMVALLWPLFQTFTNGNPVYPHGLSLLGMDFAGSPGMFRESVGPGHQVFGFYDASVSLFSRGFYSNPLLHNGLGLGGVVALITGGLTLWSRKIERSQAFSLFLAVSLIFLLWVLGTRINYPGLDHGRYILAVPLIAVVAVARIQSPRSKQILLLIFLLSLPYALPWRWSALDFKLVFSCAAAGAAVALTGFLFRRDRLGILVPAAVGVLTSLLVASALQPSFRADYYAGAAKMLHFNSGPIAHCASAHAYPAWEALAQAKPLRIAVAAGTSPLPTHWYTYPLLGAELQHTLLYVPTYLYYPDELEGISPDVVRDRGFAWLDDLREQSVDVVMVYPPGSVEQQWIAEHPEHFELIAAGDRGESGLYRFIP